MESMYKMRDMLCRELDTLARDGSLSKDRLDVIDKITHSIKSIDTIIAMKESGYSNRYGGNSYNGGYRWNDGGYSRSSVKDRLMDIMRDTTDSHEREAIQRTIDMM